MRGDTYEGIFPGDRGVPVLDQLLMSTRGVEIAWLGLEPDSPLVGRTLAEQRGESKRFDEAIARYREVDRQVVEHLEAAEQDLVGGATVD